MEAKAKIEGVYATDKERQLMNVVVVLTGVFENRDMKRVVGELVHEYERITGEDFPHERMHARLKEWNAEMTAYLRH